MLASGAQLEVGSLFLAEAKPCGPGSARSAVLRRTRGGGLPRTVSPKITRSDTSSVFSPYFIS